MASGGFPETALVGFRQDTAGNFLWLTQTELGRGTDVPLLLSIPVAADGTLGTLNTTHLEQFTQTDHLTIAGGFLVTSEDRFRMLIAPDTVTTFRLQNGNPQFASQCPSTVPACNGVLAIAASPNGKVIYTISGASDFSNAPEPPLTVNALALDSSTGVLVPFGKSVSLPQGAIVMPITALLPPLAEMSSDGSFLFISRNGDGVITTITVDPTTGQLGTPVDSMAGGPPNAIVSVAR
jgi:6-phosphogluconolactonase (cycloisomerase 2 family)